MWRCVMASYTLDGCACSRFKSLSGHIQAELWNANIICDFCWVPRTALAIPFESPTVTPSHPPPEPVLIYCQLVSYEQTTVIFDSTVNIFLKQTSLQNVKLRQFYSSLVVWVYLSMTREKVCQGIHTLENRYGFWPQTGCVTVPGCEAAFLVARQRFPYRSRFNFSVKNMENVLLCNAICDIMHIDFSRKIYCGTKDASIGF